MQISNSSIHVNGYEAMEQIPTSKEKKTASVVVFDMVKEIVSETPLWGNILRNINESFFQGKEEKDKLLTACGINAYALNILLVGEIQAKRILECLSFTTSEEVSFCGPYSKGYLTDTLFFHNFLSGNAVLDLNKHLHDHSFDMAKTGKWALNSPEYTKSRDIFKKYIVDLHLTDKIDNKIYDYNNNVISSLENEINNNRSKVSENCSFIYHVAITEPNPSVSFKGSVQSVIKSPIGFLHVFNLEHYYDNEKKSDCIRLHQAWKDKFSLAQSYADEFKDPIDISKFCQNFKDMLSYDEPPHFDRLKRSRKECFNVINNGTPAGVFRMDIKLFTGGSVRYATSMINPEDCLKHIEDAVKIFGS